MKILGLTLNRNQRVASHLFNELQHEMSKIHDITFIKRNLPHPIGMTYVKICNGESKLEPVLNDYTFINNEYDIIFTDAAFLFLSENGSKINIPKIMLLEDQHGEYVEKYMKIAKNIFDVFFVRYKCPLEKFHPYILKKKFYHLPHCVNIKKFKNLMLDKKGNVLSIGNINSKTYPLRNKVNKLLSSKNKYKYFPRPKEGTVNQYPIGDDYIKVLNMSKSVVSCTAKVDYAVLKTFEIPACNSALLSNYNSDMSELGFIPNENFLEITENNILDVYEFINDNGDIVHQITLQGTKLIHERHSTEIRAKEMTKYFKEII